jgi:hypothetical protein
MTCAAILDGWWDWFRQRAFSFSKILLLLRKTMKNLQGA